MIGKPDDQERFEKRCQELQAQWLGATQLEKKKLKALGQLQTESRIADIAEMPDWKYAILLMKLDQLEAAPSAGAVDEVMTQAKKDNKRVYIPIHSKYWLVEEEALFWMNLSLENPLSSEGHERYMNVFRAFCEKYDMKNAFESVMGA